MEISFFEILVFLGIVFFFIFNLLTPFMMMKKSKPSDKVIFQVIEATETVVEAADIFDGDISDIA